MSAPLRRRLGTAFAAALATLTGTSLWTAPSDGPAVSRISSILQMPAERAAAGRTVQVQGTVVYADDAWALLFVADDSGVVFVDPLGLPRLPELGSHLVLSGTTASLRDGIGVKPFRIETVGRTERPTPVPLVGPIKADRPLLQWVTVEGLVRSAAGDGERASLRLLTPAGMLNVHLALPAPAEQSDLVAARLRLRGVLETTPWATTHPHVWVQGHKDLTVLQAPTTWTALPIRTVADVRRLWSAGEHADRIRMRVQAVRRDSHHTFVVQDDTGQMHAEIDDPDAVPRGYAFDLLGFLETAGAEPVLVEASRQRIAGVMTTEPRRELGLPTIRLASEVRALSHQEAERGYPVQLDAVVTCVETGRTRFFVQDGSAGLYVLNTSQRDLAIAPGTHVEIEGFTGPGVVAPVLVDPRVRPLGTAPPPPPRKTNVFRLVSGQDNSRRVVIDGVIRSIQNGPDGALLILESDLQRVEAQLPKSGGTPRPEQLLDANVRVRAVAGNRQNWRGQPGDVVLCVPRLADIEVLRVPPVSPFSVPVLEQARQLRTGSQFEWGHRHRLSGTVLHQTPDHWLYLKDATGTFSAQLSRPLLTFPGEQVEVSGFPTPGRYLPSLEDAVARMTTRAPAPAPMPTDVGRLLGGANVGELVTVQARVVTSVPASTGLRLLLQSAATVFEARLETETDVAERYDPGSLLELAGICELRGPPGQDATLEILLRDVRDVQLLEPPPWWTPRRAQWLLTSLTAVLAAAFAWGATLRRQVRRRTLELRQRLEREAGFERHHQEQLEDMVAQRTKQLEQAQAKLIEEERLAALGKLTATVSHELRNPLATIRGCVFLVADSLKDAPPATKRALERAERNIQRCNGIIEELLEYVRSRPFTTTRTNVDAWLEEIVPEIVVPQGVTMVRDFRSGASAEIDGARLLRCIINLIANAVDAVSAWAPEGSRVERRIRLSSRRSGDRVEICVGNNGSEIPYEVQVRMFEPFFSTKSFGIGLGLPTVKQIIERHHGGVEFATGPETTTFTLWLPAAAETPGKDGSRS